MLAALLGNIAPPPRPGRGKTSREELEHVWRDKPPTSYAWRRAYSGRRRLPGQKRDVEYPVREQEKIERAEIEQAVEAFDALAAPDAIPAKFEEAPFIIEEARDILDAYSVSELLKEQDEARNLIDMYTEYMIRMRDEEDIAIILLLM